MHDNIGDAAVAIETFRVRDDVDPNRIIVIGRSEGAAIATELAAADQRLAGAVLLAGTATPGNDVQRWQTAQVSASVPRPIKLLRCVLRQDVVRSQRVDDMTHLLRTEAGPPSLRTYKQQGKRPVDARLLATATTWTRQVAAQPASGSTS